MSNENKVAPFEFEPSANGGGGSTMNPKIARLMASAEDALSSTDFEQAVKILNKVLKADANNVDAMDLLGEAFLQSGQPDKALQVLRKSAEIAPFASASKWMNLGQLQNGTDSLGCYQKGVELLIREAKAAQEQKKPADEMRALAMQISSGFCSMAELYMTDLCDENNAAEECERLLQKAVSACAQNVEAFQALVSLRLVQGNKTAAAKYMGRCLQLLGQFPDDASYQMKSEIAKSCIELEQYGDASIILERLLEEDDCYIEVWFLAGSCYAKLNDMESAVQYLSHAQSQLAMDPDEDLAEKINSLLAECRQNMPPGSGDGSGGPGVGFSSRDDNIGGGNNHNNSNNINDDDDDFDDDDDDRDEDLTNGSSSAGGGGGGGGGANKSIFGNGGFGFDSSFGNANGNGNVNGNGNSSSFQSSITNGANGMGGNSFASTDFGALLSASSSSSSSSSAFSQSSPFQFSPSSSSSSSSSSSVSSFSSPVGSASVAVSSSIFGSSSAALTPFVFGGPSNSNNNSNNNSLFGGGSGGSDNRGDAPDESMS